MPSSSGLSDRDLLARDLCGLPECYPAWIYGIIHRALYEQLASKVNSHPSSSSRIC